jgi:hypothetical protein
VTVYAPHDFTIAVVDLPRPARTFPGLLLSQRANKFGREDWISRDSYTKVELESAEIANRYDLLVRRTQDRERLMRLFKPTFQLWLADQPRQVFFEYDSGTLVVYVPRRAKDADTFYWLLDCTRWIAKRIIQEGEPITQLVSLAPPTGVKAFPSPPPATKPRLAPRLAPVPEPVAAPTYVRASMPPPAAD